VPAVGERGVHHQDSLSLPGVFGMLHMTLCGSLQCAVLCVGTEMAFQRCGVQLAGSSCFQGSKVVQGSCAVV